MRGLGQDDRGSDLSHGLSEKKRSAALVEEGYAKRGCKATLDLAPGKTKAVSDAEETASEMGVTHAIDPAQV